MRLALLHGGPGDAEGMAALAWAEQQGWEVSAAPVREPGALALAGADVVWCHAGQPLPAMDPGLAEQLVAAVHDGTHVVLTLLAVTLAPSLHGDDTPPRVEGPVTWRHAHDPWWPAAFRDWPDYPHVRGFQGWGTHPLFTGLQGGTFTWRAREGDVVARAVYERPAWPRARVIAVDRSYVHLHADTAVAWEYEDLGRTTCLGANVYFAAGDAALIPQRDALLHNALADRGDRGVRAGWPAATRQHASVSPTPRPRALAPVTAPHAEPMMHREPPDESWVTLGAARGLVVGTLARGVTEAWLHPLCALDALSLASDAGGLLAHAAGASPVHLQRTVGDGTGDCWHEVAGLHPTEPEFVYAVTPARGVSRTLALECRVPLRLAWPYPADALAPLRAEVRQQGAAASVVVTGCDGRHCVAIFLDGVEGVVVEPDDTAPRVRAFGRPGGTGLRMVVRASVTGVRGLGLSGSDPGASLGEAARLLSARRHDGTRFEASDATLAHGWEAAVARLANFMADAPGGGRGLLAGFAASRPGWNASRPGYAWFFGRDACWCVDALLAAGRFIDARDAIALLARTADVTGKVIHESTMSGVAHYDAADSTPLFLRAVAAYAEWTGDHDALRAWWPAVQRAMAHVRSCDGDGDGLPENTGVGHGWIEMGPLGGGAVTSYVAAIWIDAMRRLAPVSRALGDLAGAAAMEQAVLDALRGLEGLRLPDGRLALHRDGQGRLFPDLVAMATVPIALGVDVSSSVGAVLNELAHPRFTAPWGLRMLPVDDPRYNPNGYHAGTAWPLFTGWAALAECAAGRVDAGLARVRAVVRGAMAGGTGGFAEVLQGDTGAAAGVCPDQAWSAAMAVTPVVQGLAGVRPDAMTGRCELRAALPADLRWMELNGLRVGSTRMDVRWARDDEALTLTVRHVHGPRLVVAPRGLESRACVPGSLTRWRVPTVEKR